MQQVIRKLLADTDPYLGSVADRPLAGKSAYSRYRRHDVDALLSYDVGNAVVRASISPRGAVRSAHIYTGSYRLTGRKLPGTWCGYRYVQFCSNAAFSLRINGQPTRLDAPGLRQDTSLIRGVFPLTTVRIGNVNVRQFVMAPVRKEKRLRALLFGLCVQTEQTNAVRVALEVPELRAQTNEPKRKRGAARFVVLGRPRLAGRSGAVSFTVRKGRPIFLPIVLVMAESRSELEVAVREVRAAGAVRLISDTVRFFCDPLGAVTVDGRPAVLGSIVRRARHAVMVPLFRDRKGTPLAGPYGSDQQGAGRIWMVDSFYNYLGAGLSRPQRFLDGIRFFLCRSIPPRGTRRWFHGGRSYRDDHRIHSLVNAAAPLVLAGLHYRLTGDGASLASLKGIDADTNRPVRFRTRMIALLDRILATRRDGEPHLFQAQWISDGPARGRYHTGSNLFVWLAFRSAARILEEVYRDGQTAAFYRGIADRMAEDIRRLCIDEFQGRRTFNEGTGVRPVLHDGEQSGTTVAPFLGFCEPDNPALLNYKKLAFTAVNPQWHRATDSLVWITPDYRVSTAPGFMSDLAAADSDKALRAKLRRLCSLADLDGQWWWWPHHLDEPEKIFRGTWTGKSGWATCVFLTYFLHTILGVRWDAPTRGLVVKPFLPWKQIRYEGLRLGSLRLDYGCECTRRGTVLALRHNQDRLAAAKIILRAPRGVRDCRAVRIRPKGELAPGESYYGRATWQITFGNVRARRICAELAWK